MKTRERKRPGTSRVASKAKARRRLWRRGSVPCPRKTTRPKSSNRGMKKEWAVVWQAAKQRRKSAQSARTTAKKANVGNARDQARASIAES